MESSEYQGSASGEVEMLGPAMSAGAPNERRTPAYSSAERPSRMRPSPGVKAGVFGKSGLKRNRRTSRSGLSRLSRSERRAPGPPGGAGHHPTGRRGGG